MSTANKAAAEKELVVTRVFDAPRELVFKAWTQARHFEQWWGPKNFTVPFCEFDPRPGGKYRYCMRSPEGTDIWCQGIYREVISPEKIVYTSCFADKDGNLVDPADLGMAGVPEEMLFSITFKEDDGKTLLTARQSLPLALAEKLGAPQGWNQSLDKLAAYLAKI